MKYTSKWKAVGPDLTIPLAYKLISVRDNVKKLSIRNVNTHRVTARTTLTTEKQTVLKLRKYLKSVQYIIQNLYLLIHVVFKFA